VRLWPPILLSCLALLGGGCATVPTDPAERADFRAMNDPLEPLNRKVFAFNLFVDNNMIKPIAKAYVRVVPRPVRDSIKNFVSNLGESVVFGNDVLQLQFKRAEITACRFVLNTSIGIAGIFDFAETQGYHKQTGDFGQTLYAWGVPEGPYLVLPILGPSNPRDAAGQGMQAYLDPYRYVVENNHATFVVAYSPLILGDIDRRARAIDTLDAIQREAIDYYASLRSLFRQDRSAQLRGNAATPTPELEDFYEDPGRADPANSPAAAGPPSR